MQAEPGQPRNLDGELPPDVLEALRQLQATGKASFSAAGDASKAFRSLLAADVSLARSAFGRTLALTGVAIVFGSVGGLMLAASIVAWMALKLGMPWSLALLLIGAIALLAAAGAGWGAMKYFEHTRMKATRRQLARLGIGELADFTPNAGSAASTKQVVEQAPPQTASGQPVKDDKGVEVTPP